MTAGTIAGAAAQRTALETRNNNGGARAASANAMNMGAMARMRYTQLVPQVDSCDTVSLSRLVPEPLSAKTLEDADAVAGKLLGNSSLKKAENEEMREDNIFRAVVALRLFQRSDGTIPEDAWVSGLNPPSKAEMREAYRRLTQRVVGVQNARDIDSARQMRLDLLDAFRGRDWGSLELFGQAAAVA